MFRLLIRTWNSTMCESGPFQYIFYEEIHLLTSKIPEQVLIQQLRELERDGLVTRHVYQQMPPKVEYGLTEYGVTANTIVDVMCAWGRDNIALRQQRGEDIVLLENNDSES
ncbi:helix-turn-helix domain-containing protein [Paenibacillus amylolyticus]|uniref:winged helix-turn-helix transcriptional regulator n=1 Tax=Paenibacillus amylolyticus TaxID=1451 RepID=UPI003D2CB813